MDIYGQKYGCVGNKIRLDVHKSRILLAKFRIKHWEWFFCTNERKKNESWIWGLK